jgi:hypothetical protein
MRSAKDATDRLGRVDDHMDKRDHEEPAPFMAAVPETTDVPVGGSRCSIRPDSAITTMAPARHAHGSTLRRSTAPNMKPALSSPPLDGIVKSRRHRGDRLPVASGVHFSFGARVVGRVFVGAASASRLHAGPSGRRGKRRQLADTAVSGRASI